MNIPRGTLPIYFSIALAATASLFFTLAVEPVPTLVFPVLVSMVPLVASTEKAALKLRWTATALLLAFVVLGLASVGAFYLPSLLAMLLAAERAEVRAG